jgi:hypothetical protein
MDKKRLYKGNVADIIMAVLVIAISLTPLFSFNKTGNFHNKTANIYHNNKLVKQIGMDRDTVFKLNNMKIEINNGRVRIAESDCPRQICVHAGWIKDPAQTLICVPNKVMVQITGDGEAKYDAVSY